jgi:hypothetical protein
MGRIERLYPWIIAVVVTCIAYWMKISVNSVPNMKDVLSAAISVSSIIVRFLGAMASILIAIVNNWVFKRIRRHNAVDTLVTYLQMPLFSGLGVAGISLYLLIVMPVQRLILAQGLFDVWAGLTGLFVTSAFRVIDIILRVLRSVL